MDIHALPAKAAARSVLESLPDDASWEDVQYHLYVRQQIDVGLVDSDAGRLINDSDVRQRLDAQKLRLASER